MSEAVRYPEKLEIKPLERPPVATVRVPGSKSITNRALVLAALSPANRSVRLVNALRCEDSEVMLDCLEELGCGIVRAWESHRLVFPCARDQRLLATNAELFVGNSGTTMRFLTAMVATLRGRFRLHGVARMG